MSEEFYISEEAKKQGVCHTLEECVQMYANIPRSIRLRATHFLLAEFMYSLELDELQAMIKNNPEGWIHPHHFFWGMGIRNHLRKNGYNEDYFHIHNLDDIYVMLIEEAVGIEVRRGKWKIMSNA